MLTACLRSHAMDIRSSCGLVLCGMLVLSAACTPVSHSLPRSAGEALSAARPPVPGAPAGVTALVDVAVIPMDEERVLPAQTVLVQHGWVTALGPASQIKVPAGAVRVDGKGKYLIPGLADMHTHLPKLPKGSTVAEHALFRYLANGVTTIRVMDSDHYVKITGTTSSSLLGVRARAAAGRLLSPQIYVSGYVGCSEATPETIAEKVAAYRAAGYDLIKIRENGCDARLFDSLTAAARRLEMPFAGHVLPEISLDHALASGMHSIEHLTGYFEYLLALPPGTSYRLPKSNTAAVVIQRRQLAEAASKIGAVAAATRRAGVWNCPTLAVQVAEQRLGLARATANGLSMAAGSGYMETLFQLVKGLQDAGAGLLLGTDAPGAFVPLAYGATVHQELELLVQAGLTPYQALATGTRNVAVFLGSLEKSGTISVGKRADLVLLDANPLGDIRRTRQPAGVMLGGRWLPRTELDRRLANHASALP
jgi:imidazolonepropionase-like amidohydrolase